MSSKKNAEIAHAGVLSSFKTLQDGTVKIEIALDEMTPEMAARIFTLHNRYVKFFMTNKNISEDKEKLIRDLVIADISSRPNSGKKSPSQSLRNSMYVYYQKKHGEGNFNSQDFDKFYASQLNKMKESYLDAANELD